MNELQPELIFDAAPGSKLSQGNVQVLVELLAGRDWTTAAELLALIGRENTDGNRRWIRDLASQSEGRIAGGQKGYKLVKEMTGEEYNHFRNWMKSQADEMTSRILKSDKVFYSRQPVTSGNGIL